MSLFNKFISSELRIKTKKTKPSRFSDKPSKTKPKTKHPASSQSSVASASKAGLSVSSSFRAIKSNAAGGGIL